MPNQRQKWLKTEHSKLESPSPVPKSSSGKLHSGTVSNPKIGQKFGHIHFPQTIETYDAKLGGWVNISLSDPLQKIFISTVISIHQHVWEVRKCVHFDALCWRVAEHVPSSTAAAAVAATSYQETVQHQIWPKTVPTAGLSLWLKRVNLKDFIKAVRGRGNRFMK